MDFLRGQLVEAVTPRHRLEVTLKMLQHIDSHDDFSIILDLLQKWCTIYIRICLTKFVLWLIWIAQESALLTLSHVTTCANMLAIWLRKSPRRHKLKQVQPTRDLS